MLLPRPFTLGARRSVHIFVELIRVPNRAPIRQRTSELLSLVLGPVFRHHVQSYLPCQGPLWLP